MVAIAKLPLWHRAFFRPAWRVEKRRNYFLHNFANGGHREIAIMTPRFFRLASRLEKSLNSFLQNYANGAHRDFVLMTLAYFRRAWRLEISRNVSVRSQWLYFCHKNMQFIVTVVTANHNSEIKIFAKFRGSWSSTRNNRE